MRKLKIKVGDNVKVIAGASKNETGTIAKILREKNKAIVTGVNMIKKHVKPSAQNPQGGIVEKEAPIDISNLSLLTSDGQTTRVGFRGEGKTKERYSKKTNEVI